MGITVLLRMAYVLRALARATANSGPVPAWARKYKTPPLVVRYFFRPWALFRHSRPMEIWLGKGSVWVVAGLMGRLVSEAIVAE